MSTLVVIGYNELHKAEEVRLTLVKLQRGYLIDLEDAVAVTKDAKGKIKLHQTVNLTAAGATSGGFWGMLIGLMFLNPLLGLAVGASAGAVSGALVDLGINDQFMKDLAATLTPNSSALFVLVRKSTPDKVLEEVKGTGGTILKTSLSHEDETRLQAALSAARLSRLEPTIVKPASCSVTQPVIAVGRMFVHGIIRVRPQNLDSLAAISGPGSCEIIQTQRSKTSEIIRRCSRRSVTAESRR